MSSPPTASAHGSRVCTPLPAPARGTGQGGRETRGQFSEVPLVFAWVPFLLRPLPPSRRGPLLSSTGILLQGRVTVRDVAPGPAALHGSDAPAPRPPPPAAPPSAARRRPYAPLSHPAYLLPPPDVHPSRPSPLTYPPRSGVHLPQCPAPRPLLPGCPARPPASLPAVPRAAAFSQVSPVPRQSLRGPAGTPAGLEPGKARAFSQRALREGSPLFTPPPNILPPWGLQLPASTEPRRRGRRPGPAPQPGPTPGRPGLRANSVARSSERSRVSGCSRCDAQDYGARGQREASGAARGG